MDEEKTYPRFLERIKAAFTDSAVIVGLLFLITYVFSNFESVSDVVRAAAFILVFGLYDPLMTSFSGGTIGHRAFNIRVKRSKNDQKNISFPAAIMRFIIKISLGVISFITISRNKKGRALHDIVVGSVVVYYE